jgi:MORN repeat variant
MSTQPKQETKRIFHRNGIVQMEESFRKQKLHGRRRTWHRNGQMATEEFYLEGLLHGIGRQWNEDGKLLGSFEMQHGTGIQKSWHDNGKLAHEFGTVGGEFCGRDRIWLRDGTLIADEILLNGRSVTVAEYRRAAANDTRLPKLQEGDPVKMPRETRALKKHILDVFVAALLKKRNQVEVLEWLNAEGKAARWLGRFRSERSASKFVGELYLAGAVRVIAPDIYEGKRGEQFSDNLLVKLPKGAGQRKAIRAVCQQLRKKDHGAVRPEEDWGEAYLYILMY